METPRDDNQEGPTTAELYRSMAGVVTPPDRELQEEGAVLDIERGLGRDDFGSHLASEAGELFSSFCVALFCAKDVAPSARGQVHSLTRAGKRPPLSARGLFGGSPRLPLESRSSLSSRRTYTTASTDLLYNFSFCCWMHRKLEVCSDRTRHDRQQENG